MFKGEKEIKVIFNFLLGIFLFSFLFNKEAFSNVKIEFPDEELAQESVLPVFEEKVAILNRRVNHDKKFEFNIMAGMVVSEPLYSPYNFGLSLSYHFNNTHGIHIMGTFFTGGLTGSGEDLKNGEIFQTDGQTGVNKFDPEEAPYKNMFLALHYQYTAYYGKISITRDRILNLTLSGLFGGGAYIMDGLIAPAVDIGISQRLYFTKKIALRFDIIFSMFNGPDITSGGSLNPDDGVKPEASDFDTTLQFDSNVYFGISFLL